MADTVIQFINEVYKKELEEYESSRGLLSKAGSWIASFFYQKSFRCHVDLSESLFDRLKQEQGIQATGTAIDVSGFTVRLSRETETDVRIITHGFSSGYDSKHYGLTEIIENK
ncbi:MAG: hypothetical protein KAT77_02805 [Nanoarchaeota archaeon]|nr:hypothetical protein [Nanoarchaeota archaeon]